VAKTTAPTGFEEIHRILGGALREVERSLWPAHPHLGGPLPVLSTHAQVDIGLVVAAQARLHATPKDLFAFDRCVETARIVAGGTAIQKQNLDVASQGKRSDELGIKVAKLVARAAYNHLYAAASARNTAGTCVVNASTALARHIAGGESAVTREFLQTLDDAIVMRELASHLEERAIMPSSPVVRVVSRPAANAARRAFGLVLARLADGQYGLFVKLRQTWAWHEGDRASMFATVPDGFMEQVSADLDG